MEKQYTTQTITETIEVGASAYTKALATSMASTKESLLRKLLDETPLMPLYNHEIKVDFNGQK